MQKMIMDYNIPRCSGKWEPNGKTYVANECVDCVRFQQRFEKDHKTRTMTPPDTVVCESKITWTRPTVFIED